MSDDFITRLQLQLRDAAERETQRGRARRLGRAASARQLWRPALVLAAIALAAIGVISVAGSLHHRTTTPAGRGPHLVIRKPFVSAGGGVWAGFGSVWAADQGTGELLRVDPSTLAVRARIPVGANPSFDVGAGAVWGIDGRVLLRIDPTTNRIAARIALPDATSFVIAGRGAVWVVNGLTLLRVDPRTNAIDRTISLARSGFQVNGGASDGRYLYFSRADGTLLVFDARTGARLASPGLAIDGSAFGAAARGVVFLAGDKAVSALNVHTARTLWSRELPVQNFNNGVLDGRTLWVEGGDRGSGRDRLWRLDAATGRVTGSLGLRDFGAPGMAPVAGRLWLVSGAGVLQVIQ
jgi:streptogramin lyase